MPNRLDNIRAMCSYLSLTQRWCTARELAVQLHTTTRTVRAYVRSVNSRSGTAPIASSPQGYRWMEQMPADEYWRASEAIPQTPRERIFRQASLMLYEGSIDIFETARELAISDYTLQTDLPQLRTLCRTYGLTLSQHHSTLSIEGAEERKRPLIAACIRQVGHVELLMLSFIEQAFPDYHISELLTDLITVLEAQGLSVDGAARYELLLRMAIQISRISSGNQLDHKLREIPDSPSHAWQAAVKIAENISAREDISYPDSERAYLTLLIYAFSIPATSDAQSADRPAQDFRARVEQSLAFLCSQIKLSTTKEKFIDDVTDWYTRMLARQHAGLVLKTLHTAT